MSDNADRPAQSGGAGSRNEFDVNDVDALLANVEALTSKVESEVGLPVETPDAPAVVADRIAGDVASIEQSVAESAAEAGAMLAADSGTVATALPADDAEADELLVTADDIAIADEEIFADAAAAGDGAADAASSEPGDKAVSSRWNGVLARAMEHIDAVLAVMDRPFAGWSGARKALVGYVAIATLVMAAFTWILVVFR